MSICGTGCTAVIDPLIKQMFGCHTRRFGSDLCVFPAKEWSNKPRLTRIIEHFNIISLKKALLNLLNSRKQTLKSMVHQINTYPQNVILAVVIFLSKLTSCGTLIKHIQRNWTGQTVDFKNDFKMESGKYIYCNFDVALDIWTVVFRGGKTSSNMKVLSKILWENQKQAVAITVFAHCLNNFETLCSLCQNSTHK